MASVTIDLLTSTFSDNFNNIAWNSNVGQHAIGDVFSADGDDQNVGFLSLTRPAHAFPLSVSLGINEVGQVSGRSDLTAAFEATGRIIIVASDGVSLEITMGNDDPIEPYFWYPDNSVELEAFIAHFDSLVDKNATLTLSDEFKPATPVAPTLTGTDTTITAVGVAPNDNGRPITSYDWRWKRTSTSIWGNRFDQTNLTQAFTNLQANTEYEVQFRATNSEGDSEYSPSALFTTTAIVVPPPGYTNIPDPIAGDEWDLDDFKLWIVDNIRALHALYTNATPGSTFDEFDVVVGGSGGALAGVALANGSLLVGGSGTPVALAVGSGTQRLRAINGVVQWVTV